jgi:K+-transporting ATPase KdpF subunit
MDLKCLDMMVIVAHPDATVSNGPVGYIIGGIIAFLILGYLIYTLLRPDKF